jgi:ABC-2 type transport system permease protein
MIVKFIERITGNHLLALMLKEMNEIVRNKYLVFLLLIPPVVQLLILGAALDPQVRNLDLGVVDYSYSQESRDLIDNLAGSEIFRRQVDLPNEKEATKQLEQGKLDAVIIIPDDFSRELNLRLSPGIEVLVDGANAYSAGIASSYLLRILTHYRPQSVPGLPSLTPDIEPNIVMLYNPGELSSWYFVPGVLGATLTLTATLVASAAILRERESGTMDQLLMTPARGWEIQLAKVIPLTIFLVADVFLAIAVTRLVFGLPFRGSFAVFVTASVLYVLVGIGVGMLLGTVCTSQRQAQLASFFINIPLIQLSGTVVPYDTMPKFLQILAICDPLKYYATIARSTILKGAGLEILWPELLTLAFFCIVVLTISVARFHRQIA